MTATATRAAVRFALAVLTILAIARLTHLRPARASAAGAPITAAGCGAAVFTP